MRHLLVSTLLLESAYKRNEITEKIVQGEGEGKTDSIPTVEFVVQQNLL